MSVNLDHLSTSVLAGAVSGASWVTAQSRPCMRSGDRGNYWGGRECVLLACFLMFKNKVFVHRVTLKCIVLSDFFLTPIFVNKFERIYLIKSTLTLGLYFLFFKRRSLCIRKSREKRKLYSRLLITSLYQRWTNFLNFNEPPWFVCFELRWGNCLFWITVRNHLQWAHAFILNIRRWTNRVNTECRSYICDALIRFIPSVNQTFGIENYFPTPTVNQIIASVLNLLFKLLIEYVKFTLGKVCHIFISAHSPCTPRLILVSKQEIWHTSDCLICRESKFKWEKVLYAERKDNF